MELKFYKLAKGISLVDKVWQNLLTNHIGITKLNLVNNKVGRISNDLPNLPNINSTKLFLLTLPRLKELR